MQKYKNIIKKQGVRAESQTSIYYTTPYHALGCGRALLWNALPVARRALGARWKDPTPELGKRYTRKIIIIIIIIILFLKI